jgi:hypothetical protein
MSQQNQDHTVRRIVLPSGRSIEVVRFHEAPGAQRPIHTCPDCLSELVQPVQWCECAHQRWSLELECPNCFWTESGVYERNQVEELEERLDDGLTTILADLQRLTRANMAEEIERFSRALAADLILPEDF